MRNKPRVIDLVVNNNLCIGCGLCTSVCPTKALEMKWESNGFLIPLENDNICADDGECLTVCPFNPFPSEDVRDETKLANLFLKDVDSFHPQIGKYKNIYAGYSKEFRLTSSSGGIGTYVLQNLLKSKEVNHIISVKESNREGYHYEYSISSDSVSLLKGAKTRYYPVTLSTVLDKLNELEGKVALVGVACFLKSIRLAQHRDPYLKEKISFLVGIICGGVKSSFFTEYLSSKAGVSKGHCSKPEFRIKNLNSSAGDYSFGANDGIGGETKLVRMKTVGDMWGTGLFKSNACDFCDDVTTELADISLGDAWMDPYMKDGKGTNVIVTRSLLADKIINEGIASGELKIEVMQVDDFLSSQSGSFNHRQKGLPYRIKKSIKKGLVVPPKRFESMKGLSFDFKIVQYFRMITREKSFEYWKETEDAFFFDMKMKGTLKLLKKATTFHRVKKNLISKNIIDNISRRIKYKILNK